MISSTLPARCCILGGCNLVQWYCWWRPPSNKLEESSLSTVYELTFHNNLVSLASSDCEGGDAESVPTLFELGFKVCENLSHSNSPLWLLFAIFAPQLFQKLVYVSIYTIVMCPLWLASLQHSGWESLYVLFLEVSRFTAGIKVLRLLTCRHLVDAVVVFF